MSYSIENNFVIQWGDTVSHLAQQQVSRLRHAVLVKNNLKGYEFEQPQIEAADMRQRSVRHGDTPLLNVGHKRRFSPLTAYDWADLIDNTDDVATLIDPVNAYTQTAAAAMGRTIDTVIIDALGGKARTSATTTATVSFDTTNQQIALQEDSVNAGLTFKKLLSAADKLRKNEAYGPMNDWHLALSSEQLNNLLGLDKITSADYNAVKALVNGEIDTFMGFRFHHSELLPKSGTTRTIYAWSRSGVCLGIGKEVNAQITTRADKNYATQVYACIFLGAVRLEEKKVVSILCHEN